MRKQPSARIPGVLMRKEGPLLISVNPSSIQKWLHTEHFLGRRYTLVRPPSCSSLTHQNIEGLEPMEVYPTTLGMDPVSLVPVSVAFAPWKGEVPRQRLFGEIRGKTRKWEAGTSCPGCH